jgi:uncharacterized protein with HEPN domain
MLSYAREARELVGDRSGGDLASDRMRFLAVTRAVEVVGEAAAQTPEWIANALTSVPFRQAADMRNRIIHGYGSVSADILADTVRGDFPALITVLEAALAGQLPDEAGGSD